MTLPDFVTGDQGINSIHSNRLVARILQDYAGEVIEACKRVGHTMGSTWP
jgi:hypothetical protein